MSFSRILVIISLFSLLVLAFYGCAKPPKAEIDAAEAALKSATEAGAGKYASAKYKEASDMLSKAKKEVENKKYKEALQSAITAKTKAEEAKTEAEANKTKAKGEVETLLVEAGKSITNAKAKVDSIAKALKIPADKLQPIKDELANLDKALEEGKTANSSGDYITAKEKLTPIKNKALAAVESAKNAVQKLPPVTGPAPRK